jgi:DNA-binding transcriptional ArsR family regulator
MKENHQPPAEDLAARRNALASPFRLELISLFGQDDELSVSDMARRTGRPATSLYHHLGVLEDAGIIHAVGSRPKGKRFETVYAMTEGMMGIAHDPSDPTSRKRIAQTVQAAFRSSARDLVAALDREDLEPEGPHRNTFSLILNSRVSPELLERINERLRAIEELIAEVTANDPGPTPEDQFLSLTICLAPIRGRSVGPTPSKGEES